MYSASAPRKLGLSDAGRTKEHERSDWTIFVRKSGAGTPQGGRNGSDRFVLTDHALAQNIFDPDKLINIGLKHPLDRNAGPLRNDRSNIFLIYGFLKERSLAGKLFPLLSLLTPGVAGPPKFFFSNICKILFRLPAVRRI